MYTANVNSKITDKLSYLSVIFKQTQGLLWGFRLKGSEIYNKIFQILDNGEKALLLNEFMISRHN